MQLGFFDETNRLEKLSQLGDSLERLNSVINWEMFRPHLNEAITIAKNGEERKGPGGRPRYDVVLMFKILVLQRIYNLSDDQTEFQINDRMSFMRFLGLGLGDRVPDAKTIWLFKDNLSRTGKMKDLFVCFDRMLEDAHLITHTGTIVDATFVDAPKQRNTRDENEKIKSGEVPEEWQKPEKAHMRAQKDTDARWAKKNNEVHFGYKDHVKADADSKFIIGYAVTNASVHDSQLLPELIDSRDRVLYADSGYTGKKLHDSLPEELEIRINEKGQRCHPLTDTQKESNRLKSRTRARIEHIFGFMTGAMHGITLRSIGMARAKFNITLTNLVYNICRYEYLQRKDAAVG